MIERIKLYDMRLRNYPCERGDTFRSLQVFKCPICGSISNKVIMGGSPGYGIRTCCPNGAECWHHVLEYKLRWNEKSHPKEYKLALAEEIKIIRKKYADPAPNEVLGEPDLTQESSMTNYHSYQPGSFCPHGLLGNGPYNEESIELAKQKQQQALKIGPDEKFEILISGEHPHVQAQVRFFFYGEDTSALLFPKDDWGPNFSTKGELFKQALANQKRVNEINRQWMADESIFDRMKKYPR